MKISNPFVAGEGFDRKNNINVIRFIAAAMVVYGHMAHLAGYPVPLLFGQEVSSIAVKVFFVLSGYLIAKSYERDSHIFRYFVRRCFRIFPGLIFLCFLTAFVIGPLLSTTGFSDYFSSLVPLMYFIKNCLLNPQYGLPGVFEGNLYPNAVNGSLWTLPVEFAMYILLPLFYVLFKKIGRGRVRYGFAFVGIVLLILSVVRQVAFPGWNMVVWGTGIADALVLAPYFFAGAFFATSVDCSKLNLQWAVVMAFLVGIVQIGHYWMYEVLVFATLPYITLACSFASPAVFGRVFATNDYSYGLYLWGFFVQQIMVLRLGSGTFGLVPYSLLCLAVAFACAFVSWHLVEKPANNLGKRITNWSRNRRSLGSAGKKQA